jgi:hydroxymethylbilane synthase
VNTRLKKLDSGEYDATILAAAGLQRMDLADRIDQLLPSDVSLHAVGQGALGIECREGDEDILRVLKVLEHEPSKWRCLAERAFLRDLEGGCQVPIGVNTSLEGDTLTLAGLVASVDGKQLIKDTVSGPHTSAEDLGTELAQKLRAQGAQEILNEILAQVNRG